MAHTRGKKVYHPDMDRALNATTSRGKNKEFQLFSEDEGPQLYHPPNNLVTKPLITKNLPIVFENLPVYGRPEPGMSLNRFNKNKLKEFIGNGITDRQFKELARTCSTEHLKCGRELMVQPDVHNLLLMNVHVDPTTPACTKEPPQLKILDKNKERMEEDKDGRYLKNTLKYRNVHLIPIEQQAMNLLGTHKPSISDEAGPALPIFKKGKKGKGKKSKKAFYSLANKTSAAGPTETGTKKTTQAPQVFFPSNVEGMLSTAVPEPPCQQLEPGSDILIRIRIYKPFDYEEYKNKSDRSLYNLFYHDLILSGRHKVSDIKDSFICSEKTGDPKEKSNNGFLFIKNGFYVDNDEASADHADSLRQWCSMRNFGNFPKRDMRACRLDQLEYKLGNPDVYIHDTTCEHIIIFSEVRLLNANDPLSFNDYPKITAISQNQKALFCYNCAENNPKWIVSGCTRIPFNMALFCHICLMKVLHGDDGKKICKFKAYPYRGSDALRA